MGLRWLLAHHSRGSPLAKAAMSAAVPRPRLSAWPGGAGSQKRLLPYKIINAPIAPGSQSFLSNVAAFCVKKSTCERHQTEQESKALSCEAQQESTIAT